MSTRCNIVLTQTTTSNDYKTNENDIVLYHHHDGYPSGVGFVLHEVLTKAKFFDSNSQSVYDKLDITNTLIKKSDAEFELTRAIHGDIDYLYIIDIEKKKLTCKPVNWDDNFEKVIAHGLAFEIDDEYVLNNN